ncbi:MAG: hypothetical protein MI923_06940 [Phycisphaerales bacterium]|nr:hypothetical protein [Phycisphaerales bacterium]
MRAFRHSFAGRCFEDTAATRGNSSCQYIGKEKGRSVSDESDRPVDFLTVCRLS